MQTAAYHPGESPLGEFGNFYSVENRCVVIQNKAAFDISLASKVQD
jgi:hypothetical protein